MVEDHRKGSLYDDDILKKSLNLKKSIVKLVP